MATISIKLRQHQTKSTLIRTIYQLPNKKCYELISIYRGAATLCYRLGDTRLMLNRTNVNIIERSIVP